MNGSLKVVQALVLLSIVGLFFSSCGGNQSTLSSTAASGTTTGGNTGQASGTPTIEEEEAAATIPPGYDAGNLFVAVPDSIDFSTYTSIAGAYTQRCSFTSSSLVNDLTCAVEVNELSLFFNGIKFQMNIPANQCKYINTFPYWFYNNEIGTGPTNVTISITKDASGVVQSSACTVDGVGPFSCGTANSATPPAAWADVEFNASDDFNVKCRYDTSDEDGGINCCLGKYNLTRTEITPDGTTTSFERGKEWGGSVPSCIGGPGRTSWETFDPKGYPSNLLERLTPNQNRTKIYAVKNVSKSVNGSQKNYVVANYFSGGVHDHAGYGVMSGTTSVYPYFVEPISDRSGSEVKSGNPFYIFDCLDEAFETNYRIRMVVQDWDTVDALQSYMGTGVSSPVGADEPGFAPAACPGLAGDECNQADDLDNFVLDNSNITWSSFNPTFPASRTHYFPKDSY